MRIKDMFERDIDRNINGVIKVGQNDDANIEQELSEYVVTRELRGHFSTFYDAYEAALDAPTDKIGVWISGFFGSGKSHFLKMLSYLLSNKDVNGKTAIDYIGPRFEDELTAARARRAASVPTEAILFNIDSKSPSTKDKTAIMRVFARVFYENQGYYGNDLKLARLERFIDKKGKMDEFRAAYEDISNMDWLESREDYVFHGDDIAEALDSAGVMSEDDALRWLDGAEDVEFSIDDLTNEIAEYAERRAQENGGQFRLLFMVDEIGQYIGSDTSLMLNLQTLVEDLGSKCSGRVWVMVTSQEAIDEVTQVAGNDFSKIQGRFNTRLSLSGSCADEVIRRRILSKTPDATDLLTLVYNKEHSTLSNIFTFKDSVADLTGYRDAADFAECFPFARYQFRLLQRVMSELRKQGNSGKHLSSQERSMLSGFQEAAQKVQDRTESALVPFWMFYDTVQTFLESYHRAVINRAADAAARGEGLEPFDVNVLKMLFLLRWVDREIATSVDNLTTLMTDDIHTETLALQERLTASLERLIKQNYVSRSGDRYQYLTDDEQEVAQEIARTQVEPSKMTAKTAGVVFTDLLGSSKLTLGESSFPVQQWLDNTRVNGMDGLLLRVIACADGSEAPTHEELVAMSSRNEAVVVLNPEVDYYGCLLEAARIDQHANTMVAANLPENRRRILSDKQQQKNSLEKQGRELVEQAIRTGQFYVNGNTMKPSATSSAKKLMEDCLARLVDVVYHKHGYITKNYKSDSDIKAILNGTEVALAGQQPNERALVEMERKLKIESQRHQTVTMGDLQRQYQGIPFGWRELDIAAVAAELLGQKKAKLVVGGQVMDPRDSKCPGYLRSRSLADKAVIEMRRTTSDAVKAAARHALETLANAHNLPTAEDELADAVRAHLEEQRAALESLLNVEYRANPNYPGYNAVVGAKTLIGELLGAGADPADLLGAIAHREDDLLGAGEDLDDVRSFFPDQQKVFDRAGTLLRQMETDREYLASNAEASRALEQIKQILDAQSPYGLISQLPGLCQQVEGIHRELLDAKRQNLMEQVREIFDDVEHYAAENDVSLPDIERTRLKRRDTAHSARTLTQLDAALNHVTQDQSNLYTRIEAEHERKMRPKPAREGVTVTVDHSGESAPSASSQVKTPPKVETRVVTINHSRLFPPKALTSEADVDAYLANAREFMLKQLEGATAIKIS